MIKQELIQDNEWWLWAKKSTHTCCDCGLVHDVLFKVTKDNKIKTKWSRNENETRNERRKLKRK